MRGNVALLALASLGCLGCAVTRQARLYDVDSPNVLVAGFRDAGMGHGPIWIGEKLESATCRGEYVTVPHGTNGWGTIYGQRGFATVAGAATDTDQPGRAIVSCSDGRVIECEYVTSSLTGSGNGACRDNRARRYRLMF
jgi:hypothetical protein